MESGKLKGRVHRFGDNVNTDLISPAQYIECSMDVMVAHAMEGCDPDFPKKVKPGDIMVAGRNFGSGSSRETAPLIIKGSGISAIVAESYARIFYRNCINIGLVVLKTESTAGILEGHELEVDTLAGVIRNKTTGKEYRCAPLPPHIQELVDAGGLLPHLEQRLKREADAKRNGGE